MGVKSGMSSTYGARSTIVVARRWPSIIGSGGMLMPMAPISRNAPGVLSVS